MGGNKHKNGIVCMYPGCEKTMRTQKFKLHFTKQHLKPGEVYTVEHRRRFEVARDEEYVSDTSSPHPLEQHLPIAVQIPTSYQVQQVQATAATVATTTTAATNAVANAATTAGNAQVVTPSGGSENAATAVVTTTATANEEASTPAVTSTTIDNTDANATAIADAVTPQRLPRANPNQPRSSDGRFGYTNASHKRPVSAIEPTPAAVAAMTTARTEVNTTATQGNGQQQVGDLSRAVLVEYIEMMDQRFHELIQKMGQVIDGQRELIDMLRRPFPAETAQLLEQTPSLATSAAASQPSSQSSSPPENLAPTADSSAKKRRKSNSSADLQAQQQPNGGTMSLL
uniref:Uncharacterized protein n=1 Tax=Globisporangium ultimum (strain ATCC 200006 / CBS 805.95 / DAOM BR144) TaxID=431595 RepID=K3WVS6_GLOUD